MQSDVYDEIMVEMAGLRADIGRLTTEVEAWRECARYTPMMEGPAFMGWDRSALDRCRKRFIETANKRIPTA